MEDMFMKRCAREGGNLANPKEQQNIILFVRL